MEFKCCKCGLTKELDSIKKGGSVPPGFVFRKVKEEVKIFCTACAPDPEDSLSIEDIIREIESEEDMPKVSPYDWITVGNRNAVVCKVFDNPSPNGPHVEVVFLDERNRAIEDDATWNGSNWEFSKGIGGGYADRISGLRPFIAKLRAGRWR